MIFINLSLYECIAIMSNFFSHWRMWIMWKSYPHFVWKTLLIVMDCENVVRYIFHHTYRAAILHKKNVDNVENLSTANVDKLAVSCII